MTPRERFIAALRHEPLEGLVPHFELVFFLTMESLGKVHPSHRYYAPVSYTHLAGYKRQRLCLATAPSRARRADGCRWCWTSCAV